MALSTPKMGGRSLAILFGGAKSEPKMSSPSPAPDEAGEDPAEEASESPAEEDTEEAGETYEVTPAQLDELQQNGSVKLESGCTLKMADANEAEGPTETE